MKKVIAFCLFLGLCYPGNAQKQYTISYESGKKAIEGKWTYADPLPTAFNNIPGILKQIEKDGTYGEPDDRRCALQQSLFGIVSEGTVSFWYPSGNLWRKASYKHASLNGPYESYYWAGERYCKGNYVNGMIDGEWNYYYRDGELRMQTHAKAYTREGFKKAVSDGVFKTGPAGSTPNKSVDKRMDDITKAVVHVFDPFTDRLSANTNYTGQQVFWGTDGDKEAVVNYKDWLRDGAWIIYQRGEKLAEAVFHHDSLIMLYDRNGKNALSDSSFTYEDVREVFHRTRRNIVTDEVAGPVTQASDPLAIEPPAPAGTPDDNPTEPSVYTYVQQMPEFPGNLNDYFKTNLKYPQKERELGIEELIGVQFVVKANGSIDKITVVRGSNEAFKKEAVRLVEHMPNWKPGKQNGMAVDVLYTLPVKFKLN